MSQASGGSQRAEPKGTYDYCRLIRASPLKKRIDPKGLASKRGRFDERGTWPTIPCNGP